jgi:peptidoglycan hydrolase CwlO-like protein
MTNPIIITSPQNIIAGSPAVISYQNQNITPMQQNTYVLKNQIGVKVSDNFIVPNNVTLSTFYFTNVYLNAGLNTLTIYNVTTGADIGATFEENAINIEVSSNCFKEGTKILCKTDFGDKYIPIEQLDDNVYVKTYKHGYKRIKFLLQSKLINTNKRTINKLYVMKKTNENKLINDLYVTGGHALLVNELDEKTSLKMNKLINNLDIGYERKIDDKEKLIACFDKRFKEHNELGLFNIYHLVLENEKNEYKNYGIYANGILAESTDEITLSRMNDFKLINLEYKNKVEAQINKVEPQINNVEPQINKVEPQISKVEPQINKVEIQISKVEKPINKVEKPINKVEKPMNKVEKPINKVEKPINKVEIQMNKVEPQINKIETSVKMPIKNKLISITSNIKTNQSLNNIQNKYKNISLVPR